MRAVVGENGLVSGTKVESSGSCSAAIETDSPNPQPTDLYGSAVQSIKLTIGAPGDEATQTRTKPTGAPGPRPVPWPQGCSIRWASTHFPDGTSVTMKVEAVVHLWERQNSNQTVPPPPDKVVTVTGTRTVKVVNRVLAWKTKVTADGVTPWSAANSTIIDGVVAAGRSAYTSAKYGDVPVPVTSGPKPTGTDLITWQQVINDRAFDGKATALFGMTHGFSSAIEGSYGGNNIPFIPDLASSPAWAHVAHPLGYHINVFYSCETMVTSHADSMPHQHGNPPPGQWVAAGRVGFRRIVHPVMIHNDGITSTNHTLSEHAEKFFQALNEGYTLDKARRIANQFVFGVENQPQQGYGSSRMMLLWPEFNIPYADPYATLRYVYLGPGERPSSETTDTRWYYVLP